LPVRINHEGEEYFSTIGELRSICAELGLEPRFERLNRYVRVAELLTPDRKR
jgi:hypothetical protein